MRATLYLSESLNIAIILFIAELCTRSINTRGGGRKNCKIETQNKEKKVKNDNKKFRFTSYIQNDEKKSQKKT